MVRLLRRIVAWFGSIPTTTIEGRVFLTGTGVFAVMALASGRNGPLLVLAVLVAVLLVSIRASGVNLRHVEIEREIPGRVRVGEEFTVRLRLTNRRRFTPAIAVRVRDALHPAAVGAGTLVVPVIPPGTSVDVSFRARIRRRGAYRITNAMLVTSFPFGLMERRALRQHPSEILVTPREIDAEVDLDGRARSRRMEEITAGNRRPGTDDFAGIREYRSGDNPRWIAWKASARQSRLMVREFDRPRRRRVLILLDTDTAPVLAWARRPALERAVSVAAGLARRLRDMRRGTCLAAFEPRPIVIPRIETAVGHRALLESLSVLRDAPGRTPMELLDHVEARLVRGATVVLVTPRPDADWSDLAARVRANRASLRVVDAAPRSWSTRGRRAREGA